MIGCMNMESGVIEYVKDFSKNVIKESKEVLSSQDIEDLFGPHVGDIVNEYEESETQNISDSALFIFKDHSWCLIEDRTSYMVFGTDASKDHRKISNEHIRNKFSFSAIPGMSPYVIAKKIKMFV